MPFGPGGPLCYLALHPRREGGVHAISAKSGQSAKVRITVICGCELGEMEALAGRANPDLPFAQIGYIRAHLREEMATCARPFLLQCPFSCWRHAKASHRACHRACP